MLRDLYHHYIIKRSGLFDTKYYLTAYLDVRDKGMDPLMHYIKFGWKEGRDPSDGFSTKYYLENNPDVRKAGINPLVHYVKYGKKENRLPREDDIFNNSIHLESTTNKFIDNLDPVINGYIFISHEASQTGAPINLLYLCKTYKQHYGDNLIIISVGGGVLLEDFSKISKTICLDRSVINLVIDETIKDIFITLYKLGYRNCIANTILSGQFVDICNAVGFNTLFLIHELPHAIEKLQCTNTALKLAKSSVDVVFAANYVADKFINTYNLPKEFLHIIPQGIRPSMIYPGSKDEAKIELFKKLKLNDNSIILLGAGLAQYDKGTDLFLEVANVLYSMDLLNNIHFVWLGNWENEFELWKTDFYSSLAYKSNIHLLDFESDPAYIFAGSDLFLLTSRQDAFPSVALEALANQTPVIMFKNTGGIEEILDGINGVVLPNLDSREMAEEIIKILNGRFLNIPFRKKEYDYLDYLKNIIDLLYDAQSKNNQKPIISVVIPVFDRTKLLINSIESILNQSYKNFELILVCDGSPPETLEIVNRYERNYEKVRAFYFKNNSGNAVRGRNKGIKEARGKYIAFQDSDDESNPDRLIYSLEAIQKYEVDVVYGGWKALVDGFRETDLIDGTEIHSPECDFEMLKTINVPCQSTVMAKIQAIRDCGGFNTKMKYREDHELWLRMAYRGYKFKAIDKILTNLWLHKGNLELSLISSDEYWYKQMLEEYSKEIRLPPKIGYVIPGTGISGGIAIVCEHVNKLLQRGYDVSILTEDNSIEISWFPGLLANVVPICQCDDNFDILIATGWTTAYTVRNIPSTRKLYFVQSDESRFFSKDDPNHDLALATYEFDFEFITIARWLQNWLFDNFKKDSVYAPNGINNEIIHQVNPLEPKTGKIRILLEGPIDVPFKGMEDAFNAVRDLDCEVWCVSTFGKPKPNWKYDRFFYEVPYGEMNCIYSSCDILLKMSRVEGCPLPPLEMMACGGTAVLGKVSGIEEYAENYYNSIIVEEGDIIGAKEALSKLINNKDLLDELKTNAKKTAEKFLWKKTIDILEDLFCC